MKIDGGLSFVTGPMGSGKTLFEVRGGVRTMLAGGWWITNIPLYDEGLREANEPYDGGEASLYRIARHVAPFSGLKRRRLFDRLRSAYIYTEDLQHALSHGVHPTARVRGTARARLGWDESYAQLNAREWDGGRGKSKDDRAQLLEMVPMLRKLNVHGYLIAQHEETVDKNMRRICNYVVRMENKRESTRVVGMRLPFLPPLFIAHYYAANQAVRAGGIPRPVLLERFVRGWQQKLYDTYGLLNVAASLDEEERIIWLGSPVARRAIESPTEEGADRRPLGAVA